MAGAAAQIEIHSGSFEFLGPLAPECLLVVAIVVVLAAPLAIGRSTRLTALFGLIGLLGALLAAIAAADFGAAPRELFAASAAGPGMLMVDGLTHVARLVVLSFAIATLLLWVQFDASREQHAPEFVTLFLCSALGMLLMASSTNLIIIALAIELASLPSFVLAGFDRHRKPAAEAALKYAVFGIAMSGFFLYGASLLFATLGTLHVPSLADRLGQWIFAAGSLLRIADTSLLTIGLLGILAGVGFKIAVAPMHFWCPDVFEGASLPIATWLSVASKAGGLLLLTRITSTLAGAWSVTPAAAAMLVSTIVIGLIVVAAVTVTWANLAALSQTSVRRLLAYSSIAHAGNMVAIAAVAALPGQAGPAVSALVQYLAIYAVMNYGAFLALAVVGRESGSETVDAFTGLGWRRPVLAFSLTICLVSLIGLPPLGGFVAKFWVIWSLAGGSAQSPAHAAALWGLVLVLVVNTAIALYYYAKIIRQMYLVDFQPSPAFGTRTPQRAMPVASIALCAAALLVSGTVGISALKWWGDRVYRGASPLHAVSESVVAPQVARDSYRQGVHASQWRGPNGR